MRYLDFSTYYAPNQPGANYTGPFTQCLADAKAQGMKEIYFPKGAYYFYTAIPTIQGVKLVGKSASETIIEIKHLGNGFFFDGMGCSGGGLEDLTIYAAGGGIGNVGLYLYGQQGSSPDFSDFRNVIVTAAGGSSWNYPLLIDGNLRTTPQGVRSAYFSHCEFFAGVQCSMMLRNAVYTVFDGVGCFPAGGSSGDVIITDGSQLTHLDSADINGTVYVTNGAANVWQNGTKIA